MCKIHPRVGSWVCSVGGQEGVIWAPGVSPARVRERGGALKQPVVGTAHVKLDRDALANHTNVFIWTPGPKIKPWKMDNMGPLIDLNLFFFF